MPFDLFLKKKLDETTEYFTQCFCSFFNFKQQSLRLQYLKMIP